MKNPFRKRLIAGSVVAAALFAGCGNSDNFVFTNTVPVNNQPAVQAPVAQNDSFAALGNATLNQAASGVLANDTLNGATITEFQSVGNQGGTLALNQDGGFTYTPLAGFVGAETFSYTIANSAGESTATVTLTSTGLGRFVDNSVAEGGTGTQASPFDTLAEAVAVAQSGDTIFVARGNGTNAGMTGGFTLPAGVNLVGEGTGLILAQTIVPAGQAPTIEGPINCMGNNVIQGLTIDGSTDQLIQIDGVGNVTVTQNTLSNPTEEHIEIADVSGNLNITNNRFDSPPDTEYSYVYLVNNDTNATIDASGNSFFNASSNVYMLVEMYAEGTSALNVTSNNNIAQGTAPDQFEYGLYLQNDGTALCNVVMSGNQLSNFSQYPIGVFAFPGPVAGTISGNMVSDVTSPFGSIYVYAGGGTLTLSGNVVSDTIYGIQAEFDGPTSGTLVIDNNNVSNSDQAALYVGDEGEDTSNKVAIRNNTFSGSGSSNDVVVEMGDNGTVCADVTGNTFNKDLLFDQNSGGVINVERRTGGDGGPLENVNTFISGSPVFDSGTINSVAADFCAIP